MRINPTVFETTIGEETVLLNEGTGRLALLDTVASAFWHGLSSGLKVTEITVLVANQSGADAAKIRRDFSEILDQWVSQGFLLSGERYEVRLSPGHGGNAQEPTALSPGDHRTPTSKVDHLVHLGSFGIGDVKFDLCSTAPEVKQAAVQVFDHLRVESSHLSDFVLTVERQQDGWTLFCDGKYEAHCCDERALAPMLHANTLLLIYQYSSAEIALHAASVAIDNQCIILPGKSGSGKSTLSAALMSEGFRCCGDDLVLLAGPDLEVIPASLCIGLKEGAWEIIADRSPTVTLLATHIRADGKSIRYLPPLPKPDVAGREERLQTSCLVFPTYDPKHNNEHRKLSPARALVRLTESGYDVTSCLDRELLRRLICWIEGIPCVELRYNSFDYAVGTIVSLRCGDNAS